MIDALLELIGLNLTDFYIDDNVLFTVLSLFALYSVGYMFNMITTLLERLTAKRR